MSVYNPAIGGGIIEFPVSQTDPWNAGNYAGVGLEAPDPSPSNVLPWPAPAAGVVSDLACQGLVNNSTGGTLSVTLYKATEGASPVFNLTSLSARVLDNTAQGYDADPAHSFAVAAGDLVLVRLTGSGTWDSGQVVTALWTPSA
mgnify:FL=1